MKTRRAGDHLMAKQILLNAFNMNCIGHINHGLWTHPRDTSTQYKTSTTGPTWHACWSAGCSTAVHRRHRRRLRRLPVSRWTLKESIQLPVNDPLLLVSAMAAVTRHLGFGLTANLTYEAPYLFARRLSTLDHLSRGRVGWNIVTGYLDSAAGHGPEQQPSTTAATTRPTNTCRCSTNSGKAAGKTTPWSPTAAARLCAARQGAQGQHHGEFYRSRATTCASPRRSARRCCSRPAVRRGPFAGNHAECVFISGQNKPPPVQVDKVRASASRRAQPAGIKVFMGIT
jgi:alkanesulfonate monooxygenase SsuD/methylene tetrahydromethanopterin reductase-like flavin-dependent oxidoreductase (luciferase family)